MADPHPRGPYLQHRPCRFLPCPRPSLSNSRCHTQLISLTHSLSTYGGDDDFFSVNTSSADRATTFGMIQIPTLFLWSGADEYVPPDVNGSDVINAFNAALPAGSRSQYSGVVPEAEHVSYLLCPDFVVIDHHVLRSSLDSWQLGGLVKHASTHADAITGSAR